MCEHVSTATADASPHRGQPGCRPICDALRLFDICEKTKCRRAGRCLGAAGPCIRRNARIVPDEVWDWVKALVQTFEDDLSQEEVLDALEPFKPAYLAWISGVMAGSGSRHPQR